MVMMLQYGYDASTIVSYFNVYHFYTHPEEGRVSGRNRGYCV